MKKLKVRCPDLQVFEVDQITLEAKSCGCYDPYCYIDPEPDVEYIELSDWNLRRMKKWN